MDARADKGESGPKTPILRGGSNCRQQKQPEQYTANHVYRDGALVVLQNLVFFSGDPCALRTAASRQLRLAARFANAFTEG